MRRQIVSSFSATSFSLLLALTLPAAADGLPALKDSLDRAHATGDPFIFEATLEAATARSPENAAALQAHAAALKGKTGPEQAAEAPAVAAAPPEPATESTPPQPQVAEAAPPESVSFFSGWTGEAELGGAMTSGNTNKKDAKGSFKLERDRPLWRTKTDARMLYARDGGRQTAERYALGTRLDRKLDERRFVFGELLAERDEFAGFDYRFTETVGYGQRFIPWTAATLELTGGVGGRQSRKVDGERESEMVVKGGLDFEWQINGGLAFSQTADVTTGNEFTVTETETALKTRLTENWQMKTAFETIYVTEVPPGDRNLDTRTSITLLYGF